MLKKKRKFGLLTLLKINTPERLFFCWKNMYLIENNERKRGWPLIITPKLINQVCFFYPQEADKTMLFPLLVLGFFTFFIEGIGIPFTKFNQEEMNLDVLSKLLRATLNFFADNAKISWDWLEFIINATFSVSIAYFGIFIASSLYKPVYSSFQNLNFLNSFAKRGLKRFVRDRILHVIYDWSYNRGYIDTFYAKSVSESVKVFAKLTDFLDKRIIDGITNGVGFTSLLLGEGIKYVGVGRVSSYLFLYLLNVLIFLIFYLVIYYFV